MGARNFFGKKQKVEETEQEMTTTQLPKVPIEVLEQAVKDAAESGSKKALVPKSRSEDKPAKTRASKS